MNAEPHAPSITKETVESFYKDKPIEAIEDDIRAAKAKMADYHEKLVLILNYLYVSERWKENQNFVGSSFNDYLYAQFGIKRGAFERLRHAYLGPPEIVKITKQIGHAPVGQLMQRAGTSGPIVREALQKMAEAPKLTPKKVATIIHEAVVKKQAHQQAMADAAPKPVAAPKMTYTELEADRDKWKAAAQKAAHEIAQLEEQITKLINTVTEYKQRIKVLSKEA